MWECRGDFTGSFRDTIDKEGNLTAGSSAGPWLLKNGVRASSTVNGVQSTGNGSENENSSPEFRDWVMVFYTSYFGKKEELDKLFSRFIALYVVHVLFALRRVAA